MSIINIKVKSLQPKQKEIVSDILSISPSETKYFAVRASRQSGKTYLLERIALILAFQKDKQQAAFIMATNSQTRKVYMSMISWLPKEVIANTNNSAHRHIEFVNGTVLSFYSSHGYDSVAGNSFDYMICDEFALWNRHAWGIIQPTVAAKREAKVIIASTPRGKNTFYDICMLGQSTDIFYKEYRMNYKDNEYYDLREVENARKNLPEELFRQEYLSEFSDSISNVFNDYVTVQTINRFIKKGNKFYFGIDVAGDGQDKTVLTVINEKGEVVYMSEIASNDLVEQNTIIYNELKKYPNIEGYVECNGIGKGLYDMLNIRNKHKLYTTNENKQDMVIELINDISESNVKLPTRDLCDELDYQLAAYMGIRLPSGKIRYTHPVGEHDDYVDSLLMANHARHKFKNSGIKNIPLSPRNVKLNYRV